jgi:hypothetical protein
MTLLSASLLSLSTLIHCISTGLICEYMLTFRTYEGRSYMQYTQIISYLKRKEGRPGRLVYLTRNCKNNRFSIRDVVIPDVSVTTFQSIRKEKVWHVPHLRFYKRNNFLQNIFCIPFLYNTKQKLLLCNTKQKLLLYNTKQKLLVYNTKQKLLLYNTKQKLLS